MSATNKNLHLPAESSVPRFIANRAWWLLPLSILALLVGFSYLRDQRSIERQSIEVATGGARNLFRMIALTRSWNALHGGVYVPVTETMRPNPYLDHPRRDLTTTDGQQLTMVNPAYMTRQLSELAEQEGVSSFHITSNKPIRPGNSPDPWERKALERFSEGLPEMVEITAQADTSHRLLRFMAPLRVEQACLPCHENQGYKIGDIRGGISVSLPLAPVEAAELPARRQSALTHLAAFLLIASLGGLLLELLRQRWFGLSEANVALSKAMTAAESANLAKNAFLASMSHELRTPLNAIIGNTHLLDRKLEEASSRTHLNGIRQASTKLLDMFKLIFDIARAEIGELDLAQDNFELASLVDKLFATLRHEAAGKGLGCRMLFAAGDNRYWLRGDTARIEQLLGQYISNAVKFSDRGEITLHVAGTPTDNGLIQVRFEITDQGIGIPPEQQHGLFGRFHQLDASPSRQHNGSGAGLYLCKRLAELMGGQVGAISQSGTGSCFWFAIDLPPATHQHHDSATADPLGRNGDPTRSDAKIADAILLERLSCLLAEDDYSAIGLWRDHEAQLNALLGESAEAIAAAIADFRFERAFILLNDHRSEGAGIPGTEGA